MLDPEMFSPRRMFRFFNALMEVVASVPIIICMAQISCDFIYYTLVVCQGFIRFFFHSSQMISNLSSSEHWLQLPINFRSEDAKLSVNHVSQFLIFNAT